MSKAVKLDLYRKYHAEYVTPKEPIFVTIGPAKYLSFTGTGEPAGERFREGVAAVYAVAFTLKMAEKSAGHDYKVCHLEAQWWTDEGTKFSTQKPHDWHWRLLMRVPDFVTENELGLAVEEVSAKGKAPAGKQVTLEKLEEGRCVQVLHVGPYAAEKPTIERMHHVAKERGLHFRGPHHEIYLSDPRRVPEQRLRTILRYPVQ
jgi:hypothetical protein